MPRITKTMFYWH